MAQIIILHYYIAAMLYYCTRCAQLSYNLILFSIKVPITV